MKNLAMKVGLSKRIDGSFVLGVTDIMSGETFLALTLTSTQLTDLLTGSPNVQCIGEVGKLNRVGKIKSIEDCKIFCGYDPVNTPREHFIFWLNAGNRDENVQFELGEIYPSIAGGCIVNYKKITYVA